MAKQLLALGALAFFTTAAAAAECEGSNESCLAELDDTAMMQLRGKQQWTSGCEWIPEDDCQNQDQYACDCRAKNPSGPCTACPGSHKKSYSPFSQGCEWLENDDCVNSDYNACKCRSENPHGPCTACPGSHKKPSESHHSWTSGCEWLENDDCMKQDEYACRCRAHNPQSPCTSCYPKSYPCDLSACSGCSGAQCSSCWSEKKTECCISQHCHGASGEPAGYCAESCRRYN